MNHFEILTRENVSAQNQAIFDNLQSKLGFVPNIYATYAYSENALKTYLDLQGAKTSLNNKEKEVVNLVVSQVNECTYCLSAHTAIAKVNGFTEEQVLELRSGTAPFDEKLDALAALAKNLTKNRGNLDENILNAFFNAGYTKEHFIDTIVLVGDKTITNYLHKATKVAIDFPLAPSLETSNV
ncbi:carboxymuconolactone decarboxylase family protein [Ascidiimonas aurantiaca]|uniref:carboxymuconolactone decarboxylase family protein n=1 Tax=Ascidiimonas aurantiaca TaxID=1685432 RepID=UPI0030EDC34F